MKIYYVINYLEVDHLCPHVGEPVCEDTWPEQSLQTHVALLHLCPQIDISVCCNYGFVNLHELYWIIYISKKIFLKFYIGLMEDNLSSLVKDFESYILLNLDLKICLCIFLKTLFDLLLFWHYVHIFLNSKITFSLRFDDIFRLLIF